MRGEGPSAEGLKVLSLCQPHLTPCLSELSYPSNKFSLSTWLGPGTHSSLMPFTTSAIPGGVIVMGVFTLGPSLMDGNLPENRDWPLLPVPSECLPHTRT